MGPVTTFDLPRPSSPVVHLSLSTFSLLLLLSSIIKAVVALIDKKSLDFICSLPVAKSAQFREFKSPKIVEIFTAV